MKIAGKEISCEAMMFFFVIFIPLISGKVNLKFPPPPTPVRSTYPIYLMSAEFLRASKPKATPVSLKVQ